MYIEKGLEDELEALKKGYILILTYEKRKPEQG
jgi:hypothetical protein